MKILVTILTSILLFVGVFLISNKNITLTVTNVINDEGKVSFFLFDEVTFMKKPLKTTQAIIVNGKSSVTFKNLKKGEYSVVCFHDRNNNNKIDFDELGFPIEDYATSNHLLSIEKTTFTNSKFSLGEKDLTLEIKF